MAITKSQVQHVARLCRLAFGEEELEKFTEELGKILEYVDKLREVETGGVEASLHGLEGSSLMREDVPGKDTLPREEVLRSAPDQEKGHFKVPGVL